MCFETSFNSDRRSFCLSASDAQKFRDVRERKLAHFCAQNHTIIRKIDVWNINIFSLQIYSQIAGFYNASRC